MSLIDTLMDARKSELTQIEILEDRIHFRYPQKHRQRGSSVAVSEPLEKHLRALEWVERNVQ